MRYERCAGPIGTNLERVSVDGHGVASRSVAAAPRRGAHRRPVLRVGQGAAELCGSYEISPMLVAISDMTLAQRSAAGRARRPRRRRRRRRRRGWLARGAGAARCELSRQNTNPHPRYTRGAVRAPFIRLLLAAEEPPRREQQQQQRVQPEGRAEQRRAAGGPGGGERARIAGSRQARAEGDVRVGAGDEAATARPPRLRCRRGHGGRGSPAPPAALGGGDDSATTQGAGVRSPSRSAARSTALGGGGGARQHPLLEVGSVGVLAQLDASPPRRPTRHPVS